MKRARAWLDETKLPQLTDRDGEAIDLASLSGAIREQSRARGPEPVPSLVALRERADPSRADALAAELFHLFSGQKEPAKDKFCIVIVAALGDHHALGLLKRRVLAWPEVRRGKMATFAIEALGAVGSDASLCCLDAVERRLRTTRRPQARAARRILDAAAGVRGGSRESLADATTPWYGFEGRRRVVGQPNKPFVVHFGEDLKIRYTKHDGVPAKSLSKTISEAERAQLKALAKAARELVKCFASRLTDCMLTGHRWTLELFRRLFLEHPILAPLASGLVFVGDVSFRPLADGSLTNTDDEPVEPSGPIRLFHPALESEALLEPWIEHLGDYEVDPPFPQLSRPSIRPNDDEQDTRLSSAFTGRPWDHFERGRLVRRMGWKPLTVFEGTHTGCHRTYPDGTDAVLLIDQAEQVVIGHYFAPFSLDCIKSSGPLVPEEDDPRLIRFADVYPPIFAEAMHDITTMVAQ